MTEVKIGSKIKNTLLYKKVVDRNNLYAAIFSLESYIFEKYLLSDEDSQLLYKLQDKFNFELIETTMTKVKKKIDDVLLKDELFNLSVFFRTKKIKKEKRPYIVESRPLHTSDLYTQIAIVAMLNVIIYDDGNERKLSEIGRILPSNFYGNIPSPDINTLFVPWQQKYREYSNEITKSYSRYIETNEFNYEVSLDIINFYPSVNPNLVYLFLIDKLLLKYKGFEFECAKMIIFKLLYFRINNISDYSKEYYKYDDLKYDDLGFSNYYSQGLVQGLPQSFFFANLCMIKISKIFEGVFPGKSFYYVDDSDIFIKSTNDLESIFPRKLETININLKEYCKVGEDYSKLPKSKWCCDIEKFSKINKYNIQVHTENKSKISKIDKEKEGQKYLNYLSKQASVGTFELRTIFSDIEDITLKNKFEELEFSIDKELERIKAENDKENEQYRKLLIRFKKYFKFRKRLQMYKEDNDISQKQINWIINNLKINGSKDPSKKSVKKLEKFFNNYDEDIFLYEFLFILRNIKDEEIYNILKEAANNFDRLIYKEKYIKVAYFSKMVSALNLHSKYLSNTVDKYLSLSSMTKFLLPNFSQVHYDKKIKTLSKIVTHDFYKQDDNPFKLFYKYIEKDYLKLVINSTSECSRIIFNSIISRVFNVILSDSFQLSKIDNKPLTYDEFRIITYVRNTNAKIENLNNFILNVIKKSDGEIIDYSILEVIDYFKKYVKDPALIDNLIQVHKYTYDIWKNGSKHLHFYTLHNQEHAIELIKASSKFIKAIDYFQISKQDYYVLLISCYLHDVSMVLHPDIKFIFNANDNKEANLIYSLFKNNIASLEKNIELVDSKEVKDMLIDYYIRIDNFFESYVRKNHASKSAVFIRKSSDLNFIQDSIREIVAEISEAHGYDVKDIYGIKSDSKDKIFSKKFLKIVLRMADLLDMSKNRITKAILNNNIDYMVADTKFHWLSHQIISGYEIRTEYKNKYRNSIEPQNSYIAQNAIIEKLILIIYVNEKYLVRTNSKECSSVTILNSKPIVNDIELRVNEKKESKCDPKSCNFMCKWMATKNQYLYDELYALQKYLNRTSNNYFKTEIELIIKLNDKDVLDSSQLSIIDNYINK